jgi:hypothetical protein
MCPAGQVRLIISAKMLILAPADGARRRQRLARPGRVLLDPLALAIPMVPPAGPPPQPTPSCPGLAKTTSVHIDWRHSLDRHRPAERVEAHLASRWSLPTSCAYDIVGHSRPGCLSRHPEKLAHRDALASRPGPSRRPRPARASAISSSRKSDLPISKDRCSGPRRSLIGKPAGRIKQWRWR